MTIINMKKLRMLIKTKIGYIKIYLIEVKSEIL